MDRSSEPSFGRFWLPLILLALLIFVLFPNFGPRQDRTTRELWDGMVVLASTSEPPAEAWRLIATVPLRTLTATSEEWVVGDVTLAAGQTSIPLLLATPPGTAMNRRLSRRVQQDRSRQHTATITLRLFQASDAPDTDNSWLGSIFRFSTKTDEATGENDRIETRIDGDGVVSPLAPERWRDSRTITLEPSRERRWIGDPRSFLADWQRFRREDPGGLAPFIHDRLPLPLAGIGSAEESSAPR